MPYDYSSQVITAAEAAAMIKDNDTIKISFACSGPTAFLKALKERAHELHNVGIRHGRLNYPPEFLFHRYPEYWDHVEYRGAGCTIPFKDAQLAGKVNNAPMRYSEVPHLMKCGDVVYDALVFQVTPPDEDGYCSFGLQASSFPETRNYVPLVIAEMNANAPRTGGDKVHVSELPYIIESNEALPELQPVAFGPLEQKIGENVASIIEDGATLQFGIGTTPNAIAQALRNHKNLGIHTEVFGQNVVDLVERGVINCSQKSINNGKITTTFINGTKHTFDWVNNNPMVEVRNVGYVNDPRVIGQNYKMTAINSCVQVDILGQINSESFGDLNISNIGGQFDYAVGSQWSEGGKFIIAMSSTYKGKASRIVSTFPPYTTVSIPKMVVDYVVTEYGVAHLRGKTVRERVKALISIAHPDFREQLEREACERRDIHHL